jgi:hypothetical protein
MWDFTQLSKNNSKNSITGIVNLNKGSLRFICTFSLSKIVISINWDSGQISLNRRDYSDGIGL